MTSVCPDCTRAHSPALTRVCLKYCPDCPHKVTSADTKRFLLSAVRSVCKRLGFLVHINWVAGDAVGTLFVRTERWALVTWSGMSESCKPQPLSEDQAASYYVFSDVKREEEGEEQQPCFLSFCTYLYILVLCTWAHCTKRRKITSRVFFCCCFYWRGITAEILHDLAWHIQARRFSVLKWRRCQFLLLAFSFDFCFFHQIFFILILNSKHNH